MAALRRALLSVSEKIDLAPFSRRLVELGFEIVSTGGTARELEASGIAVTKVSAVTGFPEILDGRVKTLHPKIHGGILANRALPSHLEALAEHGIAAIDLVAVNLYPFRETLASGAAADDCIENIDVGGPAMIRAAAKNFRSVVVVVDPADYARVVAALEGGEVPEVLRRELAAKAFAHTSAYDAAIAAWLGAAEPAAVEARFPAALTLELAQVLIPRYGENPHQAAAVYREAAGPGVFAGFAQAQGKELSYNNLLDADAARKLAALFTEPAVVIVKHGNPCGVGRGRDLAEAYGRAFACDPVSAFGSIIALNRPADRAFAEAMAELFVEVLIAPGVNDEAAALFKRKRDLRVLTAPLYAPAVAAIELRAIDGGFLAQVPDGFAEEVASWTCPTARQPTTEERRALEFAWKVARYTKSNAIVIADGDATIGIGAGQMSRVDSCRLAIDKARSPVAGKAAASDAFFPFADGLDALAAAGIKAIAQPGGSKRDAEVIAAADAHGITMLLTGTRHFRH